eukprot:Gb_02286 [translate_table: standard]
MAVSIDMLPAFPCHRVLNSGLLRYSGSTIYNIQRYGRGIDCCLRSKHGYLPLTHLRERADQRFRSSSLADGLLYSWTLPSLSSDESRSSKITFDNESPNSLQSTGSTPSSLPEENSMETVDNRTIFGDNFQGRNARRSYRARNPPMTLSQSFDSSLRQINSGYTKEAIGPPDAAARKLPGGARFYMALAFALLGVTTAAKKAAYFLRIHASQEKCMKCSGYGVERCNLCEGRGIIEWEDEFMNVIPCPLCFGSCTEKCSSCDGLRMKRGVPPFLQQEHVQSSEKTTK